MVVMCACRGVDGGHVCLWVLMVVICNWHAKGVDFQVTFVLATSPNCCILWSNREICLNRPPFSFGQQVTIKRYLLISGLEIDLCMLAFRILILQQCTCVFLH